MNKEGVSNLALSLKEPGYYEDGQFGIRLENIVMVKVADTLVCILINVVNIL
jgi:Xaa-Pro aminopeptidase